MQRIEPVFNLTKMNVAYAFELFTNEQKSACTIADSEGAEVLNYNLIYGELIERYPFYVSDIFHTSNSISEEDARTKIFNKYTRWRSRRLSGILREWDAINKKYNPIYNYDRYEDEALDTEEIRHGKKLAENVDIKNSTNTDVKNSTSTDFKTSTSTDLKNGINTDIKTATASDVKASTASDLKSAVNTDIEESELLSTKTDIRPTWIADSQTTAKETDQPGKKTTTGSSQNNYTQTTGSANNNYTQTTGSAQNNYTQTSGLAEDNYSKQEGSAENNYTKQEGSAQNNYTQTQGSYNDNYTRQEGSASNNYTQESGSTETERSIGERHMYGNIGVTTSAQMVSEELKLRQFDLIKELVREFVESIAYYVEEI